MKRTLQTVSVWTAVAVLALTLAFAAQPPPKETAAMARFSLASPDFSEGGTIASAQVFTDCKGSNVSPELKWTGAPEGTRSLALLVHDPDAPTGSGWWHWIVYNIPASTSSAGTRSARIPTTSAAAAGE